jgi:hypothetical protein
VPYTFRSVTILTRESCFCKWYLCVFEQCLSGFGEGRRTAACVDQSGVLVSMTVFAG